MNKPVIILGAGGHAKVLIQALLLNHISIIGVLDHRDIELGRKVMGIPIIGDDDSVLKYSTQDILLVNGLGSVKSMTARQSLFAKMKRQGYLFTTVIHPSAIIASDVTFGEGVQIMAGAIVQAGCYVGDNSLINTRVAVDHDCHIGDHVHIAPGAILSGNVSVGSETHIGTGATIIQGIGVGHHCLVAAGSVVIHDVPDGKIVMGVPARSHSVVTG
jgi:UDP-perosamine 4-acetyltransferase